MNLPANLPAIVAGIALVWGSGFAIGWTAGRRVTRYMLGGRL